MKASFTPGPWAWFGNRSSGVYLATPDRGRRYIMGFRRYGMNGAQPTFAIGGIMHPASELVSFADGDGTARGFKEGDKDSSVYRYDVREIDHPDARLITAAPDLYEALESLERQTVELYRSIAPHANYGANADGGDNNENTFADRDVAVIAARAALSKARGQS